MSSTEYLNYESGKFSKSKGVGVFGNDAMESGIPADVWRFYIFWNRPEKGDYAFTWSEFQDRVNGDLIGNLGNLVNRTLTFVTRYYGGAIPAGVPDEAFWAKARAIESAIGEKLERAELRDAFRDAFALADLANKRFQDGEPWKTRISDPAAAASLISDLCYVLRDLAIIMAPYLPGTAARIASFFGLGVAGGPGASGLSWQDLGRLSGLEKVVTSEVLFTKMEPDFVAALRERYAGSQKERADRDLASAQGPSAQETAPVQAAKPSKPAAPAAPAAPAPAKPVPLADLPMKERFARLVDLRVATIVKIERHPKADKLYVETLDDGSGTERVIVSGLVPYYKEEELLGRHIVLVNNLKAAKLRGVESRGMLLAAARHTPEGVREGCDVLDAGDAAPGSRVVLEGQDPSIVPEGEIDVDTFFSVPLSARGGRATCDGALLLAGDKPFSLGLVPEGEIG
jgi:methionyl-tRNA synthetase